jgi:hypothetical protein
MSQPVTTSVAGLFSDHSDLGDLNQVAYANAYRTPGTGQSQDQTFWATDARPATSPVSEVLEIELAGERLINWVLLDLATFPHTMQMEYQDPQTRQWRPVLRTRSLRQAGATVVHSVPPQLPAPAAITGHRHPQHSYTGHWETVRLQVKPFTAAVVRFLLTRIDNGNGPVNNYGKLVNYSLAIRNLLLGYRVETPDDIPRMLPVEDETCYWTPFAAADDALGSSLNFGLRQHSAACVVDNTDADADEIWLCEPQPYADAVVCFYADLGDAAGKPVVVDEIFLDPTNNGAHVSVYYSNERPVGNFDSAVEPIGKKIAMVRGNSGVSLHDGYLDFGVYGAGGWLSMQNSGIGYDPDAPWWLGAVLIPDYDQGVDDNPHPVLDCGAWMLALTADGLTLTSAGGDVLTCEADYQDGRALAFVAAYDGVNYHLHVDNGSDDFVADTPATVPIPATEVSSFSIGADLAGLNYLSGKLTSFVLKEEVYDPDDPFLADPESFCAIPLYRNQDTPLGRSALIRLDVANTRISPSNPFGLYGGPAAKFEQIIWTPVPRDYTAQRGWMRLPPIKARFFKLEFTNLQPVYHDIFVTGVQRVQRFPPEMVAAWLAQYTGTEPASDLGQDVLADQIGYSPYSDFPLYVSTGGTGTGYTNTETYVAPDYTTAQRIRADQGVDWAYQQWHSGLSAPRFTNISKHIYATENVTRSTKIAYQVGLRQLIFGRQLFNTVADTDMYEDMFFDEQNLDNCTFYYNDAYEALVSLDRGWAQATSNTFRSYRLIRGLQFAAQQSQPVQQLPDDEFSDPTFANWTLVGDIEVNGDLVSSDVFGTLMPLIRQRRFGFWGDIAPNYPTWADLEAAQVTYGDLKYRVGHSDSKGGIASSTVTPPSGGRLYAAARVIATEDLGEPLYLQILDAVNDHVLAEAPATVRANQVTEWYVGTPIGTGPTEGNTWGDLAGDANQTPGFLDSFSREDATSLGQMDSGQVWTTLGTSLGLSNGTATVTAAGQVSTFDPGTPWGTFTVGIDNMVSAVDTASSVPLLYLGILVLFNDGRLVDTNTGRVMLTINGLTDGDYLSFAYRPTMQLASVPTGADASVQSWAVTVTRNGTTVPGGVLTTPRALGGVIGLAGDLGQSFVSMNWVPDTSAVPTGTVIYEVPGPEEGTWDAAHRNWTNNDDGRVWSVVNVDFSAGDPTLGSPTNITTVFDITNQIPPTNSSVSTSTDLYGTLTFRVDSLPDPVSIDPTDYYLAQLDRSSTGRLILLRADGMLVSLDPANTTTPLVELGMMVPDVTGGDLSVLFTSTLTLSTAFKTTYNIPNTGKVQTLVFLLDDAVVGVYADNNLITGTGRALLGVADGAGNVSTLSGFAWSPNANGVSAGTGSNTWGDVDRYETALWGDLAHHADQVMDDVYVRCMQKGASDDAWYMDTLSLFVDPILWEFSNDAGSSWVPGWDVRNDPNGVVSFGHVNDAYDPQGQPAGNTLRYRVTAFAPGAWVSHLAVRPWYVGFMHSVPVRPRGSLHGPNINPWDHYPPIEVDPRWQVWHSPIPRQWWFAFRDLDQVTPLPQLTPYLGENIVVEDGS